MERIWKQAIDILEQRFEKVLLPKKTTIAEAKANFDELRPIAI